jgi:CRISPR-associated endonuclease/helicase Cas3
LSSWVTKASGPKWGPTQIYRSEPAPLEALLQRFGRVNRLGGLGPGILANAHVFTSPTDGQHVYSPLMVQETLRVLRTADGGPVDESSVGAWLADIYKGEILEEWVRKYEHSAREFEAVCLNTLHAFDCDDALGNAFYKAFDNIDVITALFEAEYNSLAQDDPLAAAELVVGIRWGQYYALTKKGLVRRGPELWQPPIVDAEYSGETGLNLG